MKVLFVFSAANADSPEAVSWLASLDALRARGLEAHVVLPEDGDGTLIAALKKRKVKIYVRYFTSWVAAADAAGSSQTKAFRFALGSANRASEKDIRALVKEQGIDLVFICEGTINAGAEAARKAGVPVLWQFNQLIGEPGSEFDFVDNDSKVAQSLSRADRFVAANGEIEKSILARCPRAKVCVIEDAAAGGGQELFDVIRGVMAEANATPLV